MGHIRFMIALCLVWTTGAAMAQAVAVTGTVSDPSGAAVANARIALSARGVRSGEATSDGSGHFRIEGIAAGRYDLEVQSDGTFDVLRRTVVISNPNPPLALALSLPPVQQSVEVTADSVMPSLDPAANLDTTTVSGRTLEMLPVFDQDVIGALSTFLDPGSISTGGTTIVVDGVEMKSAGVPKSAIQEIVINDDPYSAEYNRPGRGRIEIITKPGSGVMRGTVGLSFRNAALATRSYFAPEKAAEERRALEMTLSGPVGKTGDTSFLFTASQQNDDASAVVHALTATGAFDQNVSVPSTRTELMARLTHDWSEQERASFQLNWKRSTNRNQGVGSIVLPQAGTNGVASEEDLLVTLRSILTPQRLNQFNLTLEFDQEPTVSTSTAPAIIVRDVFVGGGAQSTVRRTEAGGKVSDLMTVARGKHTFRFGLQVPNLNRRVFVDESNRGGTFVFDSLGDEAAGLPYSYTFQQGSGRTSFWWREYGGFVQDQVKLGATLQAAAGLRYDWQCCLHDSNNFSPRFSLAWAPSHGGKTVIRGGAGLFYDRSGVAPIANLRLHNGEALRSYTIVHPSYPDPFAGGINLSALPVNRTELAPNIQIPSTWQFSLNAERPLTAATSMVVGYRGSKGRNLFRSVDVNAPLPPDYSQVPFPGSGHIEQIRSDGSMRSDALEMTFRGRVGQHLNGQIQYVLSNTRNDTRSIWWYPSDQYAPASAEWGPAEFDQRHRLNALITITAGRWINLGISARYGSPLPFNETAGVDLFHTTLSNARPPGVTRNSLRGSSTKNVDAHWSHDVLTSGTEKDGGRTLSVALDAFNAFNHPNFSGYVGNVRSPLFRSPTVAAAGRRLQLSLEAKF